MDFEQHSYATTSGPLQLLPIRHMSLIMRIGLLLVYSYIVTGDGPHLPFFCRLVVFFLPFYVRVLVTVAESS